MEIHNLMEELVRRAVDDLAREDEDTGSPRFCSTEDCRNDAICYVLNRVGPRYVSSARGYSHIVDDLESDRQLAVDLVRLAKEGLQRVTLVRRGYYDEHAKRPSDGPSFNFPTITGRVLDGKSFFPVAGVQVELKIDDKTAEMFDQRWNNPYLLNANLPGTYTFWPCPIAHKTPGEQRSFSCELTISGAGYDPLSHIFEVSVTSEEDVAGFLSLHREFKVPDLYIFES